MPFGNFYPELEMDSRGRLTPGGTLELSRGETILRIDAWVWQDESACISVQHNAPNANSWSITTDPSKDYVGPAFKPGAAKAMALMVVEKTVNGLTETETYHWTDAVLLYQQGMTSVPLQAAVQSKVAMAS